MSWLKLYTQWHYTQGQTGVSKLTYNLVWFVFHFFSTGFLLRTLFTPFLRVDAPSSNIDSFSERWKNFLVTLIFRVVGAMIRLAFIGLSLLLGGAAAAAGGALWLVWLLLPALLVASVLVALWELMGLLI